MQLQRIKIQNVKAIQNFDAELNGNVVIIAGDNEMGKTTLLQLIAKAMCNDIKYKVPVTAGQEEGFAQFEFKKENGEIYQVRFDFDKDGSEKLLIVAPGGIKSRKVSDLSGIFDYTNVSVETFIGWSNTAEGRRKQRDIILNLLDDESKENFVKFENAEKKHFDDRTEKNRTVSTLEKQLQNYIITDEENSKLHQLAPLNLKKEELAKKRASLVESFTKINLLKMTINNDASTIDAHKADLIRFESDFNSRNVNYDATIKELEEKLTAAKQAKATMAINYEAVVTNKNTQLDQLQKKQTIDRSNLQQLINETEPEEALKQQETAIETQLSDLTLLVNKRTNYQQFAKQLEDAKSLVTTTTKLLDEAREGKLSIFKNANLPIEGLTIEDDGIRLNGLPFVEEQLSSSQIMEVVLKIMFAINKKTPIITVGRAESFGRKKLNNLIEFAEKNNCQLFLDKVEEEGDLHIEIVEQKVESLKTV